MQISDRRDAQRLLAAVAAAIVVHVGLYFAVPFLTSLDTAPLPDYGPIVVTLEEPVTEVEPPKPPPVTTPKPTPAPATKPAPAPAARPAPAAAPAAPAAAAPKLAVDAGAARAPTRAPGSSAFRQAGTTTGTSAGAAKESIVSGPPPVTLPAVGSTTPGSGEQRSGEAVQLSGRPAAGSGKIDISKVDSALAGPAGGTTAPAPAAARTSGTAGPVIAWENPSAAKGRDPRSDPVVELSDAVRKQSLLPPEVTVIITVNADGLVSAATMEPSSGYIEVDKACIEAVRRVKFTAAPGAAPITGRWTFRIVR